MDYIAMTVSATCVTSFVYVLNRFSTRIDALELAKGLYADNFIKEEPNFWNCRRVIKKIQI